VDLDSSDQLILQAAVIKDLPVVFTHQLEVGLKFMDSFAHGTVLLLYESHIFLRLVLLLQLSLKLHDLSLGVLYVFSVLGLELPQFRYQESVLMLQF
jgi:hypothetical protein